MKKNTLRSLTNHWSSGEIKPIVGLAAKTPESMASSNLFHIKMISDIKLYFDYK